MGEHGSMEQNLSDLDRTMLRRAMDLAHTALAAGDEPFGSVLVSERGEVLFEDHNHVAGGDATQHPEFAIARWAAEHLTPAQRAVAVVYTSGEHCVMCAAAHGWVGLGRIVFAGSGAQLAAWRAGWGLPPAPVAALAITDVAPGVPVLGPVPEFAAELEQLHRRSALGE